MTLRTNANRHAATHTAPARLSLRLKMLLFGLVAIPTSLLSIHVYAVSTTPYTMADVAKHATSTDCWTVIGSNVYNVTPLVRTHSGGAGTITPTCGKDGTASYNSQHQGKASILNTMNATYQIGILATTSAPGAPTAVTAVAGNLQATVSWAVPASNGGSPITGYTVTSNPGAITCTSPSTTSCIVTGLTAGTSYTFTVTATNAIGTSPASAASSAVIVLGAPSAPATVTATRGDKTVTATWTAAAANGSTITGYRATATPGGATCSTSGTVTLTCTITGLTNGTAYTVSVVTLSGNGNSGNSTPSAAVTPAGLPTAPTGVTGQKGDSSVMVSWAASSPNGEPVTVYTVTATPGSRTCTTSGLMCTVTGLSNGTSYTFKVVATNAVGSSPASTASSAVIPVAGPGAPTNVSATPGNASAVVTWVAPASNGGSAITGYIVESNPDARTCQTNGALTCTVSGLTNGVSYTFTVTASNAQSNSLPSSPSSAVTPAGPPSAPIEVSASAGDKEAVITWTAPADNGSPITSYIVTAMPGNLTVNCPMTVCTFSGLSNNTSYTFTVVAKNNIGTSVASSPTNAVTPKPAVLPKYDINDLSGRTTAQNCWTTIFGKVYDLNLAKWTTGLSPAGVAGLCGKVGTAYWTSKFVDVDPAVFLESGLIGTFDFSTYENRIQLAKVQYGAHTCWTAFSTSVYDFGYLLGRVTGDQLAAVQAMCNKQATAEEMLAATDSGAVPTYTDRLTYKIGTFVKPFSIRFSDVQSHVAQNDCWTLINRTIYDVSDWIKTQGNKAAITTAMCGKNATTYWGKKAITPLRQFGLGPLLGSAATTPTTPKTWPNYTLADVKKHAVASNCWTIVNGNVFRITAWLKGKTNKATLVQGMCGKRGSTVFNSKVGGNADKVWKEFKVGKEDKTSPGNSTGGGGSTGPKEIVWTMADVKRHAKSSDCWTVVSGAVYSMTAYIDAHPGGSATIIGMCGIDATKAYMAIHANSPSAAADLKKTRIGKLG